MMRSLKPWAYGPFEVLLHAEMHYRDGDDLDRRMSMISFDNAIEVAITTYLNLHPMQRGNRTYAKADLERWLNNYHTKIDFYFGECGTRCVDVVARADEIIWFHDVRNGQYHIGGATVPQRRELDGVRMAAMEVFAVLFEESDVVALLDAHIATRSPAPPPPRSDEHDRVIDAAHGMVEVCGQMEYASDVLYGLDPARYREVALELLSDNGSTKKGSAL
ncbi:hypothetical protein [Paraburkholderia sediminicola]|uniref:hypothetical protein n=1 Tax=Paraburkholderia sediminicola TaxID=458836 RepID=UPI0038BB61C4